MLHNQVTLVVPKGGVIDSGTSLSGRLGLWCMCCRRMFYVCGLTFFECDPRTNYRATTAEWERRSLIRKTGRGSCSMLCRNMKLFLLCRWADKVWRGQKASGAIARPGVRYENVWWLFMYCGIIARIGRDVVSYVKTFGDHICVLG